MLYTSREVELLQFFSQIVGFLSAPTRRDNDVSKADGLFRLLPSFKITQKEWVNHDFISIFNNYLHIPKIMSVVDKLFDNR